MIQSYHVLEYRSHRIHSEQKFTNDTILPRSRGPKSLNPFWTKVQGWYNPTTFSRIKVTGSILDRCPGMIQSLFILEDRGHQITFGQMSRDDKSLFILKDQGHRITLGKVPKDDTIPLQHHYFPFWERSFRTIPSLSWKCSNFTRDRGFISTSTTCSSVLTYWSFMAPFYIISRM